MQYRDRPVRELAVRASAVDDDAPIAWQCRQAPRELLDWNGDRARQVAARVLDRGTDIEHEQLAPAERRREFIAPELLSSHPIRCELVDDPRHIAEPTLGDRAQCQPQA
jgi:hypothetical protein